MSLRPTWDTQKTLSQKRKKRAHCNLITSYFHKTIPGQCSREELVIRRLRNQSPKGSER
jgi:hypothetical protein